MVKIGITSIEADPRTIPPDQAYAAAVARAGAEPVWLPWSQDPAQWAAWAADLDGFLFSGGGDMDPKYFGQPRDPACGEPQPLRDAMELGLLRVVCPTGKPLLGICRGCQVLNVFLGGDLIQDLPEQGERHRDDEHRFQPDHPAEVLPGTRLFDILGSRRILTNSVHHQAIGRLAPGLRLSARSPLGVVEAVELPEHPFCLGIQWHPEAVAGADPAMQGIFDVFVQAAKEAAV